MAYGDSILDAAVRLYQPVDPLGAIQGAQNVQMGNVRLQGAQQGLEQQKLDLDTAKQLTPLEVALKRAQAKNQLFSNALSTATDASSFDQSMRELASQGFPEAEQYIGRYSPVLQARLRSVYSGQDGSVGIPGDTAGIAQPGGTGKAATAAGGLDYQFANTTPEQRAASLERLQTIADGLEKVNSPESWEALKAQLAKTGMPGIDQVGSYSPIKAASIYSRIQPILSYLQNRSIADQAGIPTPRAQPDIKEAGGQLYAVDPFSSTATAITPRKPEFSATTDALGNPAIFDKNTGEVKPQGGTFGFEQFADRMTGAENSTGDRTAQNPRSSATGNGQFIDATWLKTVKAARPELAQMADKDLLQLRKDPAFAKEMTVEYAKANAQTLAQNGQPVNATSLALAHRFGANGALSILSADPDAKLTSILPADVIKANPTLANKTAGDYVSKIGNEVGMEPIGAQTGGPAGFGTTDPNLHGTDYLKTLPPQTANTVKLMAEGKMAPPTSFAMSKPYWQHMIQAAAQYDPNFDQTVWQSRLALRKDFTSGKAAQTLTALNTALGHAGSAVLPAFEALHNGQFPTVNAAANWISEKLGNAAPTNAREAVDALASEGRKVFAASGGGNLTELENWQKNFPVNGSPEQQKGALQTFGKLLDSRIESLQDQWNRGNWSKPLDVHTFLSPGANKSLAILKGEQAPQKQASNSPAPRTAQDQQALAWANANPNDPRAAQIKKKLGM